MSETPDTIKGLGFEWIERDLQSSCHAELYRGENPLAGEGWEAPTIIAGEWRDPGTDESLWKEHVSIEGFQFSFEADVKSHRVEFVVYRMHDCYPGQFLGEQGEPTSIAAEARKICSGQVKWDGCSNWDLNDPSGCMAHFCDREALIDLGKVLAHCWDYTALMCPAAAPHGMGAASEDSPLRGREGVFEHR